MSFKDKRKSLTISTVAVAETVPWDRVFIKLYHSIFTRWMQVTFIVAVGGKCKSDYKSLFNQMHPQWCIANNWHKHAVSSCYFFYRHNSTKQIFTFYEKYIRFTWTRRGCFQNRMSYSQIQQRVDGLKIPQHSRKTFFFDNLIYKCTRIETNG